MSKQQSKRWRRSAPLKRRTPLRPGPGPRRDGPGARRFADGARFRPSTRRRAPEVCAAVEARSGGRCEARGLRGGPGRCPRRAVTFHHRWLQGQGGPDSFENLLHVCRLCHGDIHARVADSLASGLLLPAGGPITPYV